MRDEAGRDEGKTKADLVDCQPWMSCTEVLPLSGSHIRTRLGRTASEQRGNERCKVGRESSGKRGEEGQRGIATEGRKFG